MRAWFLLLFWMGCLTGCQSTGGVQEDAVAARRRVEAAIYNTQLGVAYLNQGDKPRAKRKLLAALSLAPQSAEVNAAMGYFLEKTEEVQSAKRYYQKALSLAPKSGAQRNNYGAFLCRTGEPQVAVPYLIAAAEDVQYVNAAMAYENAGLCAELMHDDEKSQAYFLRALAQDSGRKVSLQELVKLALKHHEPRRALNYCLAHALLLNNKPLLMLALRAAKEAKHAIAVTDYTERLYALNTGEHNEYDREST